MKTKLTYLLPLTVIATLPCISLEAQKANRYFLDTFDISTSSFNINTEIATRQDPNLTGGPVSWVANVADQATDFHQQTTGAILQLAGDGGLINVLVSPNFNFSGTYGPAPVNVIGKKVSVLMDALVGPPAPPYYSQASITVGSSTTLAQAGTPGAGFSVSFVEDQFGGLGNVIQVWDGDVIVGNNIPNPVGAAAGILEIFIDDPADGNPWDGVGSTVLIVKVTGTEVIRYQKTGGGYTSNYITLEGYMQSVGAGLGIHTFDGLTVFRFPDNESTLALSPFESWALNTGLGVYPNFANDSDLDGKSDGEEFAINGNPLDPANDGKIRSGPVDYLSAQHMAITFPVRTAAAFAGTPTPSATIDGITYAVDGSTDLQTFATEVIEVTPALDAGMPALSAGWEYRSFIHSSDMDTIGKGFLRLNVGPEI